MKKILFTLLLGLLSLNLYAQHMKFNGVEMTGTLNSFVAKLKAKGWRDCYNEEAARNPCITALEKSNWAGLNNVEIGVYATPKTKTTYMVMVFYKCDYKGFSDYREHLKTSLKNVYGNPIEEDDSYWYSVINGTELIGTICLHKEREDGNLICSYCDSKGLKLYNVEIESDL